MSKALTKLVTPASDRLACHDHAALEKQFLYVAQTQLEAEIPSNSAADDTSRETVTVIERFRFLHRAILSHESRNLTTPFAATRVSTPTIEVSTTCHEHGAGSRISHQSNDR
jgi:isopentenyl diphosphate isomerase/L-lactate dehydrogenase-like FMN-dependent dehydrogenase